MSRIRLATVFSGIGAVEFALKRLKIDYDVIFACDIYGSSDATIENVEPIDLKNLLKQYRNIKRIFTTGKKAKELYDKYLLPQTGIECIALPSSSAANASMIWNNSLNNIKSSNYKSVRLA